VCSWINSSFCIPLPQIYIPILFLKFSIAFSESINFEGHVELCKDIKISGADALRQKIEEILHKFGINHVTIQMEYSCRDKD